MRVIGLGFQKDVTADALRAAIAAAGPAEAVAVPERRAGHPALVAQGVRVIGVPAASLRGVATQTTSPRIMEKFGCGSVAEAVALVATGGALVQARLVLGGVTYAVAEGEQE